MFVKRHKVTTDPRLRSLIQKAVRRGYTDVVEAASHRLYEYGDRKWLRSRAVVITFEECWPLAKHLSLEPGLESKLRVLQKVAQTTKQKDAAGLGSLAYAFSEGERGVLEFVPDVRAVEIVAEAVSQPKAFFDWIQARCQSAEALHIVDIAQRYLPAATWGWDKACIIAGAFLAATCTIPDCRHNSVTDGVFPYWVALDKHTPQGKAALRQVAQENGISYRQLMWSSFYYESAKVNAMEESPWWSAEKAWRLANAGIGITGAEELWNTYRNRVSEQLKSDAQHLQVLIETANLVQPRLV